MSTLPSEDAASGRRENEDRARKQALPVAPAEGSGHGILVVDDDPAVLLTLTFMIEVWGHRVFPAADAPAALTLLAAHRGEIQLAITDLQLGTMDGPEFIRLLREETPNLPVIAISGYGDGGRFKTQLDSLGVPLLAKPFRQEDLIAAIKAACGGEFGARF